MTKKSKICLGFAVSALACVITAGTAIADELSPKETYLKYRPALMKAKSIDEVSSFLCKHVNEEISKTPAEMKPMMFDMMKAFQPTGVQIVGEDLKGNTATLTMTCSSHDKNSKEEGKGSCTFLKEGGVWKIDKEKWDSKIESH